MLKRKKAITKPTTSRRKLWNRLIIFFAAELLITFLTAPMIVFFGPFGNLKKVVVGSLYTTLSHKYMVESFLSREAIERIVGKDGYYARPNLADGQGTDNLNYKINHSDKIEYIKIDSNDLKGYMLVIHDPTRVKVGYSSKLPIEGETTSAIAKRNNAIAAINAGGFAYDGAWASTGGEFEGFIIHDGKPIGNASNDPNAVEDAIGIDDKGQLVFGRYSLNDLKKKKVTEAITFFGPQLIINGKKVFSKGETGGLGIAPRTAIGQKASGEILFLVIDGRDIFGSLGATMYDLQEILYSQGAVNAINLDGGSSSAMYYNGKLVNKPSNSMGERAIPSVFMVLP